MLPLKIHAHAQVKGFLRQASGPAQFGQHTLEFCGLFCCNQSWLIALRSNDHRVSWLSVASGKPGILAPRFRAGLHHLLREVALTQGSRQRPHRHHTVQALHLWPGTQHVACPVCIMKNIPEYICPSHVRLLMKQRLNISALVYSL